MSVPAMDQKSLIALFHYNHAVGQFEWRERPNKVRNDGYAGCLDNDGYRVIRVGGKNFKAHRLAWLYVYGGWPKGPLDHINGDRADNRICNLRLASPNENMWNSPKQVNNTSGFKGVTFYPVTRRWQARICVNGKRINLGMYPTAAQAGSAYRDAAKKYHGDFARFD